MSTIALLTSRTTHLPILPLLDEGPTGWRSAQVVQICTQSAGETRGWPGVAAAAAEVTVPDWGGRFLRARLRALPVMGGYCPCTGLTSGGRGGRYHPRRVSIPVALGYAKIAGIPVVTGLYTLVDRPAVIAARAHTGRHRRCPWPRTMTSSGDPFGGQRDVLCLLSYQGHGDAISALTGYAERETRLWAGITQCG